ncbi:MAG TPA: cysteine desulfurase family protein [Stellaceae bacterium]|nr:cysteine desulfurase family protein [Stellaceae bacterium]
MSQPAYLDWNATAPLRPEAARAVAEAVQRTGNPSSVHRWGRAARQAVERARAQVAALVGVSTSTLIFTSGGTEANGLALSAGHGRRILVSAIEHDSVREAVPEAEVIAVTSEGTVDLPALETLLAANPRPALVSLMLANNETGAIQPVGNAAKIAHRHGALLHCDAIQAAGKIAVSVDALGADLLTLSAHKLGGPQGVGALVIREGVPLAAQQRGGGQERGYRAGTENVPGILGFGAAAEIAARELGDYGGVAVLRDAAEQRLLAIAPEARVFGAEAERLPNTLCIAMPGVPAATQVMALDLAGVMVSAGAACSSGKVRPSRVLAAMGASPDEAGSAIRISLGWSTTAEEIDRLVEAWAALYRRGRADAA